jgi:hypothetical protein
MPYSLVDGYKQFEEIGYLYLQGRRMNTEDRGSEFL